MKVVAGYSKRSGADSATHAATVPPGARAL